MKHLDKYYIFESKKKKNWLEITKNKLMEFKKMIDNNPVMGSWDNNDVMIELLNNLKDISGDIFDVYYEEWIKFTCGSDYIYTNLTKNGEIRSDLSYGMSGVQNPYRVYTRITNWLDKKRLSDKEIDAYYIVYFVTYFDEREKREKFIKSDNFIKWKEEIEYTKEFLKSLGFEIEGDDFLIKATIKLQKTDEVKNKSLDLSDLVPDNIVDDFERFILRKNLTRSDAEEIAKIFNKIQSVKESLDFTPEEIMKELTLDLIDSGLQVNIYKGNYKYSNHPKFDGELHVEITDNNKVFCKKYPKDDMDWLYGKPIIMNFFDELTDFGLIRDKDYKVYGGGLGVNLVFQKEGLNKIKL